MGCFVSETSERGEINFLIDINWMLLNLSLQCGFLGSVRRYSGGKSHGGGEETFSIAMQNEALYRYTECSSHALVSIHTHTPLGGIAIDRWYGRVSVFCER